jgi:hypothetical protein
LKWSRDICARCCMESSPTVASDVAAIRRPSRSRSGRRTAVWAFCSYRLPLRLLRPESRFRRHDVACGASDRSFVSCFASMREDDGDPRRGCFQGPVVTRPACGPRASSGSAR